MNLGSAFKAPVLNFSRWEWSLFLIVVGARLAGFSYAGSPLPYYDQWLVEFNNTLIGVFAGYNYSTLFDQHNEHMLVTTKVLTLCGYLINGYWDVSFLVICAAIVRGFTAAWLFRLVSQSLPKPTKLMMALLCALVFATPFSSYNLLSGMQVSFYLADCALLWSIRATTHWHRPLSGSAAIIGGTLFGVASMGSAVAIPAATLAVHLFLRRSRPGFWLAWTTSTLIAVGYISKVATGTSHNLLAALPAKAQFLGQLLAWPISAAPIGALLIVLAIAGIVTVRKAPQLATTNQATLLGLAIYAAVNAALIAINREPSTLHMRHWEMLAYLPFVAIAAGILLTTEKAIKRTALVITFGACACYAFFAGRLIRNVSWPYLQMAHSTNTAALDHYRSLLLKQDLQAEAVRMNILLAHLDYSFFDDPIGRFSLHPVVLKNLIYFKRVPLTLLAPEILNLRPPSLFSHITKILIQNGWLIGLSGLALAITALVRKETAEEHLN